MRAPVPPLRLVEPGETRRVTLDALFQQYARYVTAVAARLLGRDDHEVDDVVQDVFWLASRRLHRIEDMERARPWLATVTVRVARRKLLRRKFRRLFQGSEPVAEVPAPGATPEQRAMLRRVYEVLDRLPVEQRLAWTLRYLEGEPLEAIAEACGCSLATAKRRISAAQGVILEVFRDA